MVFIGPIAFHNISWRTYTIFAATNFAIVPLVYFFYPETAYRSLEEVDVLFHLANEGPGNPWLSAVKISLNEPLWFGKKGDAPFDYEQSDWHQRYVQLMRSGSGTTLEGNGGPQREKARGNGGDSGGKEGNTTPNTAHRISQAPSSSHNLPDRSATNSSLSEKHLAEQHATHTTAYNAHRSSIGTSTTAVSAGTGTSERPPLPDEPVHSFQTAHGDPNWGASALAPPSPLRAVPRRESNFSAHSNSLSQSQSQSQSQSFPQPHVLPHGPTRTETGRATHLPPGTVSPSHFPESPSLPPHESDVIYLSDAVEAQVREVLGRSGVVLGEGERVIIGGDGRAVVRAGSRSSSFSHRVARDAGRGH